MCRLVLAQWLRIEFRRKFFTCSNVQVSTVISRQYLLMKLSVRHLNFHLFIVYDLYPTADLASKLFVMAQYTLHHIDAHCCCCDHWSARVGHVGAPKMTRKTSVPRLAGVLVHGICFDKNWWHWKDAHTGHENVTRFLPMQLVSIWRAHSHMAAFLLAFCHAAELQSTYIPVLTLLTWPSRFC